MIYYVEDDDNIRELVVYTLAQVGMPARGFETAAAFYAATELQLPDLVLLDIMMPQEDGLSVLRNLRSDQRTMEIPVILVTAKSTEFDKVQGLDLGADDYITKPFGMAELLARVRARMRRTVNRKDSNLFVWGKLKLDKLAHTVSVDGREVPLTLKEYELLRFLMENQNIAFTREQLLDHIWDYGYAGGTRTVDVHIQTLRAKLGECGEMVETVRGIGYRFGGK